MLSQNILIIRHQPGFSLGGSFFSKVTLLLTVTFDFSKPNETGVQVTGSLEATSWGIKKKSLEDNAESSSF